MFIFLISLVFTYINYSQASWNFFNSIGGLALAKVGPEFIGLVFYLVLAALTLRTIKPKIKLGLERKDFYLILLLAFLTLLPRLREFKLYFFADDFYYWLNRAGTSYSVYQWGPWLSSHPGWVWELSRLLGGYNPLPYQIASLFSHFLFGLGIYFLARYLTKSREVGFFSSAFFLITTIHFETFQWLSHVSNFGWQGFLMTLSVLALIWQLKKDEAPRVDTRGIFSTLLGGAESAEAEVSSHSSASLRSRFSAKVDKGEKPPYLSSFLMMAALFSGTARTGAILPILSITDAMVSFNGTKKIISWVKGLARRQWIFYLSVLVFILTRSLQGASFTRIEPVTEPLYKTFFWLVGVFTTPPEFVKFFSFISTNYLGTFTIIFGTIFIFFLLFILLFFKFSKRKIPFILVLGFIWTLSFAFYYTLFGPHVPVTAQALRERMGPHHLAYPSAVGASLIFGLVFTYASHALFNFLKRLIGQRKSFNLCIGLSIVTFIIFFLHLDNSYKHFLYLPDSRLIVREKFFFDFYRKFIPSSLKKMYIYYDDEYLKTKWNFVPSESYYWAFWEGAEVRILKGRENLEKFVKEFSEKGNLEDEIASLYYIYIDFEFPNAIDKSEELRKQILTGNY